MLPRKWNQKSGSKIKWMRRLSYPLSPCRRSIEAHQVSRAEHLCANQIITDHDSNFSSFRSMIFTKSPTKQHSSLGFEHSSLF